MDTRARKLASRWLVAASNPLKLLISRYSAVTDELQEVWRDMQGLEHGAKEAFGDLEKDYDAGQRAWVQHGNHPDDWKESEAGAVLYSYMHAAEEMTKSLAKDSTADMGRVQRVLDDMRGVEAMLRSLP